MSTEHVLSGGGGTYKLPNAMTLDELVSEGRSKEDAHQIMHERVFGVGFQRDRDGNPIEKGKGSALQPTPQHHEQLKLSEMRRKMTDPAANAEFTAGLIKEAIAAGIAAAQPATPTMTADFIKEAIAAGIKAGLDQMSAKNL